MELSVLVERLAEALEAHYVPVWLNKPLAALGHRKPIDVIAAGATKRPRGSSLASNRQPSPNRRWLNSRQQAAGAGRVAASPADGHPLFRPPPPADSRWQRGGAIEGIYLAKDASTVRAEWYRRLAEFEIEPLRGLPRDAWRYKPHLEASAQR